MIFQKIGRPWLLRAIVLILLLCSLGCIVFVWGSSNDMINHLLTSLHLINHRCGTSYGVYSFLNVGNGDSCCIYNNEVVGFIDTGPSQSFGVLNNQLLDLQVDTVDFVVLSHPHSDHAGGYLHLLQRYTVKRLYILPYELGDFENFDLYNNIIDQSKSKGTEIIYVNHKDVVDIQGIILKFFDFSWGLNEENQRSLIVHVTIGNVSGLFMADADASIENRLINTTDINDVDVLKVAHHGSSVSTSSSFLTAIRAEYAVISVGKNTYGHPSYEVCERLYNVGCEFYRTDVCGNVQFVVDDNKEIQVSMQ